ncbi:MAG: hypothetical protein M3367_18505 [Acidobacteriota bacterium]|nr:hypothetical protein [Acidobacteriota bacterium]
MENIQSEDRCQHPGCRCKRPLTDEYCSEYCRNAQKGGMGNDCKCGHPECGLL